jgi:substrate import-associated zinc metallohydrolase lipoprotein
MKTIKYIALISFSLLLFSACQKDELDYNNSIYDGEIAEKSLFDKWIYQNFTVPYNVNLEYRWKYYESNVNYNMVPASLENSKKLSQVMKYAWFSAYDEINSDLLVQVCPRLIEFFGSWQYNTDGSVTLADAAGGLRVRIVGVNHFALTEYFLTGIDRGIVKTMHHEYQHILNQTTKYDAKFETITGSDYVGGMWTDSTDISARKRGFITAYASSSADEDFAELYSCYISLTDAQWDAWLSQAGTSGKALILEKLEYVRKYMNETWKVDLDDMRAIVLRRNTDILSWTENDFLKFDGTDK